MYEKHVQSFSNAMINQFDVNKDRGGFHSRPHAVVLAEIEERLSLLRTLTDPNDESHRFRTAQDLSGDVLACSADIANLALIVAWNAKALTAPVEE